MSATDHLKKPKPKEIKPEDLPEVAAFLEAKKRIENLKTQYPGVFEELEELTQNYNTLLESAEKTVRAQQANCGPFNLYQYRTTYNAQRLYDAVGRDKFLQLGGSIQTIPQYDIDKTQFNGLVAQGAIDEVVVKAVVEHGPSYKVPPKFTIP